MAKSNKKNKKKSSTNFNKAKKQEQEVEVVENDKPVATGEEVVVDDNTADVKQDAKQDKAVEEKQAQQEKQKDLKDQKEKDKKKKKANANPDKKTAGQKTKALFSELKKVTWPTFGEACKQTGVVLLIVLIFSAVLLGINLLLGWLFGLIVG